jgi:hypothetical protein
LPTLISIDCFALDEGMRRRIGELPVSKRTITLTNWNTFGRQIQRRSTFTDLERRVN